MDFVRSALKRRGSKKLFLCPNSLCEYARIKLGNCTPPRFRTESGLRHNISLSCLITQSARGSFKFLKDPLTFAGSVYIVAFCTSHNTDSSVQSQPQGSKFRTSCFHNFKMQTIISAKYFFPGEISICLGV